MPLPVIADVYRCTLEWSTEGGVSPRNVLHVRRTAATATDVGTTLENGLIAGFTPDNMFACMASAFDLISVNVQPLDGSSVGLDVSLVGDGITGGTSGSPLPAVAGVVSLKTVQKGPRGRGRCYVGPCSESAVVSGELEGTQQTSMLNGWAAFIDSMAADQQALVVASYVHHDAHDVIFHRIDTVLGTQRRRQDQLR